MRKISIVMIAILLATIFFTGCHNKIITPTKTNNGSSPDYNHSSSVASVTGYSSELEESNISDPSDDNEINENDEPPIFTIEKSDDSQEVKLFRKFLANLAYTDINSISLAIDQYKKLSSSDKKINDQLYYCFSEFYYYTLDKVNSSCNGFITDDKKLLFEKNGAEQYGSEAGSYIWQKIGFLYETFSSTTSNGLKDYLSIKKNEDIQQGKTYLIEDALLVISWNVLSDRIIVWENFMKDHRDSETLINDAQGEIDYDLWLYMNPPYEGMKTFPYMNGKTGEDELKLSYERFISKYNKSKYQPLIKGYYDILFKSDFKINQEAKDYLKKHGIDTNE